MVLLASGCAPVEEGGASTNDRTFGGEQGEELLTGAMEVSPNGHFVLMQRSALTVVVDMQKGVSTELSGVLSRVAMSKSEDVAYALRSTGELIALDLASGAERWRLSGPYAGATLLKLTDDDQSLVVVSGDRATIVDPLTGTERAAAALDGSAAFGALLQRSNKLAIVGETRWPDHLPSTPVSLVDLATGAVVRVAIPNCSAPPVVLPDERRMLISPTFCEEGEESDPDDKWTNPDPVSVVDVSETGEVTFLKNLPGFGPIALTPDGSRAVAYLDTKRIDASMFDDPTAIPLPGGKEFHLMVIDPKTLTFSVTPIGDGLPRFAMTRDGKGLLIDSSVKVVTRAEGSASLDISVGPNGISGEIDADVSVFDENTPFGLFDLESLTFKSFSGPQTGLDRFIQLGDMKRVFTLRQEPNQRDGFACMIDLEAGTTTRLLTVGAGVRDVGLLPDGQTILLRLRQDAYQVGLDLFSHETLCLSADGLSCERAIDYISSTPFASQSPSSD